MAAASCTRTHRTTSPKLCQSAALPITLQAECAVPNEQGCGLFHRNKALHGQLVNFIYKGMQFPFALVRFGSVGATTLLQKKLLQPLTIDVRSDVPRSIANKRSPLKMTNKEVPVSAMIAAHSDAKPVRVKMTKIAFAASDNPMF